MQENLQAKIVSSSGKKIPFARDANDVVCSMDWTIWQIMLTIRELVRFGDVPKTWLLSSLTIEVGVEFGKCSPNSLGIKAVGRLPLTHWDEPSLPLPAPSNEGFFRDKEDVVLLCERTSSDSFTSLLFLLIVPAEIVDDSWANREFFLFKLSMTSSAREKWSRLTTVRWRPPRCL